MDSSCGICFSFKVHFPGQTELLGEYFVGSHVPSPINLLHFGEGGKLLVAGDMGGGLHAWKAEFPGSWGYTPHPDITFLDTQDVSEKRGIRGSLAHGGALTGLIVSEEMVISSSSDGSVSFWNLKDAVDGVLHPCSRRRFMGVPLCLCGDAGDAQGVYVGFQDGSVRKLVISKGTSEISESISLPPSDPQVVAWHCMVHVLSTCFACAQSSI